MTDLIVQIISLMALLIGIFVGEILAFRAFGRPKARILLIDLLAFVVVLTLIYNFVSFAEAGMIFYAANFFIGIFTIVFVRGFESVFRMTESPRGEDKLTVNIIRTLSHHGLDDEEIKGVLKRSGFSPKLVDKYSGMIEHNVPSYIPKIVKLENDVAEIKAGIDDLNATLGRLRRGRSGRKPRK